MEQPSKRNQSLRAFDRLEGYVTVAGKRPETGNARTLSSGLRRMVFQPEYTDDGGERHEQCDGIGGAGGGNADKEGNASQNAPREIEE